MCKNLLITGKEQILREIPDDDINWINAPTPNTHKSQYYVEEVVY